MYLHLMSWKCGHFKTKWNSSSMSIIMPNDKHCLLKKYVVSLGKLIKCAPRYNPTYFIFVFFCVNISVFLHACHICNVCAKHLICFLLIYVYHYKWWWGSINELTDSQYLNETVYNYGKLWEYLCDVHVQ